MILALIQARMSSTRLPAKVMAPLAGIPMIEHVVKRAHASTLLNYVCVATTTNPADDVLAAHVATLHNTGLYRGDEQDVLGRFHTAAMLYPDAEVIVRLTADDPLKDPALIDYAITAFLAEWADPRPELGPPQYLHLGGVSWPLGLDVEIFTRSALELAHRNATTPEDREHVTSWLRRQYYVWTLKDAQQRSTIATRYTVDTIEDLSFAVKVYDALYPTNPLFGYDAIRAYEVSAGVAA